MLKNPLLLLKTGNPVFKKFDCSNMDFPKSDEGYELNLFGSSWERFFLMKALFFHIGFSFFFKIRLIEYGFSKIGTKSKQSTCRRVRSAARPSAERGMPERRLDQKLRNTMVTDG